MLDSWFRSACGRVKVGSLLYTRERLCDSRIDIKEGGLVGMSTLEARGWSRAICIAAVATTIQPL